MNKTLPAVLLIAVIGVICYANSLTNDFVWDDGQLIKDNLFIQSFKYLPKIFTTDLHHFSFEGSNFYRPLQTMSYLVDYQIWKLNPFGYHLTNLILHLVSAVLVYFLISRMFSAQVALITGLLFLACPLNTQAVSYISGRADPMMAVFVLTSFLLYLTGRRALSIISFILAALSKETALVFPVLILAYEAAFDKKFRRILPYLAVSALFIALRLTVLKFDLRAGALITEPLGVRFITLSRVLVTYLRLLVWPVNLHMQYEVPFLRSVFSPEAILSLLFLAAVFILVLWSYSRQRIVFFGLSWFFIMLLPVSNLFIPLNAILAEHWLYLPAIGIFLIFAHYLVSFSKRNKISLFTFHFLLITIVACYSGITIARNFDWKDRITLYESTVKSSPGSARARYNLANVYGDLGRHEEAVEEYKKTIELEPNYAAAHNNLASSYVALGRWREAAGEYQRALAVRPDLKEAYNNLGYVYNQLGMNDEAIRVLTRALEINPDFAVALNNLGNAYLGKRDIDRAVIYWKKASKLDPDYAAARVNLENVPIYREKLQ